MKKYFTTHIYVVFCYLVKLELALVYTDLSHTIRIKEYKNMLYSIIIETINR